MKIDVAGVDDDPLAGGFDDSYEMPGEGDPVFNLLRPVQAEEAVPVEGTLDLPSVGGYLPDFWGKGKLFCGM